MLQLIYPDTGDQEDGILRLESTKLTCSHALVTDIYSFPRIIREVVTFITTYDNPSPEETKSDRKVFVGGGSLGGWTSLEYGLNPTENTIGIIAWVNPPPRNHLLTTSVP